MYVWNAIYLMMKKKISSTVKGAVSAELVGQNDFFIAKSVTCVCQFNYKMVIRYNTSQKLAWFFCKSLWRFFSALKMSRELIAQSVWKISILVEFLVTYQCADICCTELALNSFYKLVIMPVLFVRHPLWIWLNCGNIWISKWQIRQCRLNIKTILFIFCAKIVIR